MKTYHCELCPWSWPDEKASEVAEHHQRHLKMDDPNTSKSERKQLRKEMKDGVKGE